VRYGGFDGPDLPAVARIAAMTEEGVVRAHCASTYVVGFIGFSPGFPYLLGLNERLVTPRLDTPRPRVEPGSVGLGGAYTGVYPRATPGGWRLIGRTDVELFDPDRKPPSLLKPGDRVRFVRR
jgi:KipI family sensor histidine kinase inhibitor